MHELFAEALSVVLTGFLGWGMALLKKWLDSKVDNDTSATIMRILDQVVDIAVREVEQTTVRAMRREAGSPNAKLSAGNKEAAKMKALDRAVAMLGTEGAKRVQNALGLTQGSMLNMLSGRIEAEVHRLRRRG